MNKVFSKCVKYIVKKLLKMYLNDFDWLRIRKQYLQNILLISV